MANEYASLETLKLALAGRAAGSTTTLAMDDGRDDLLNGDLAAASRGIDAHCGRRFWLDQSATAREFPVDGRVVCDRRTGRYRLLLDDMGSTSGLVVEIGGDSTWTVVADYRTEPRNALADSEPITALSRLGGWGCDEVRVTARWGWPTIPDVVVKATLLQAARLYRRKDSPEGVVGNAEWGTVRVSRIDPDVQALVSHLVLPGFA